MSESSSAARKPLTDSEIRVRAELASAHPHSDKSVRFVGYAAIDAGRELEQWSYHPRLLGPSDVEIEISHCGICASDLHTLESGWSDSKTIYPCIAGHEIIGRVGALGSDLISLNKFRLGDRVGVGTQVESCLLSSCSACSSSNENYCPRSILTYNSKHADGQIRSGGYANTIRVHERFVFPIPHSLPSDVAAPLLCAGITVYSPLRMFYKGGMRVGVVGIGGLGHLAIQFARAMGADVTAFSSSNRKKEDAIKLGAHHYVNTEDKKSAKLFNNSIDLLILTAHNDNLSLDSWLKTLKQDGKLIAVGLPNTPLKFSGLSLVMRRASITGSFIGSPNEITEMLHFADKHRIYPWIEKLPMAHINEGIKKMKEGNARYRVVLENHSSAAGAANETATATVLPSMHLLRSAL